MASPLPLSIILITRNEAANLPDCLASLGDLAAEIVVVDSGSTDRTIDIARTAGARIIETSAWPGFGPQKNLALDAATCDWVLSLDADERLTEALRAQIGAAIDAGKFDGYSIPRLSYFCGKPVRHCGWYPDHVLRLFKRGTARFSDKLVHESVISNGPVGKLSSPMLHYSYRDRHDVERKVQSYSEAGARQMQSRGRQASRMSALIHGAWAFLRTYFFQAGLLDGATGFHIAVMNMRASYGKYAKLAAWQNDAR